MNEFKNKAMYKYLMVLTIASSMGFQTWRTLFNNFAVEKASLLGSHIGMIQSIREIPGFLTLLAIYVMLVIKEHHLSALSVIILGLGVGLTGFFPSYTGLIFTTLIMSFGFHYFETTNQSLTLQYFDTSTAPKVMGKLRGLSSGANIIVGLCILSLSGLMAYKYMFLIAGGGVLVVGVWAVTRDPTERDLMPQHKKMIFKKKYWLYYLLTFIAGARRQVLVAFAVFLMVKVHHFSLQEITILFVINNVINYFVSPQIGRAIVRFGERKVLSLEYGSLIFIFLAYAFVSSRWIVALLYISDHIFFNFAMAIRTYFQKIGDPKDIAPSMAVGFTINHIAAVVIPVLGGLVWMVDYRIPFIGGAVLSVVSLGVVQLIQVTQREAREVRA